MKNEKYDNMDHQERDQLIVKKMKKLWITLGVIFLALIIMFIYHSIK